MPGAPVIRPVRDRGDLEAVVDVVVQVTPHDIPSVDEIEHWQANEPDALLLLAHVGERLAGSGWGAPAPEPGRVFSMIRVVPRLRGRGVGSALYAAVSEHARQLGGGVLQGRVLEEDTEARGFLERRGFQELNRRYESTLELAATPDVAPEPPHGVTIVSLAGRPELVPAAYDIERESLPDIPTAAPDEIAPFEKWVAKKFEGPGAL
ncbi:MAG: GNAT family N-acetyltransferase, partial [Gaiellaceae bacterium]